MDDDIKTAADAATNCVQALEGLRSAAWLIVDMKQEHLGRDTLLKAKKDLNKYCGSEFVRVIESVRPILLEARSKHLHAKQSTACRVTKPTAMEVALILACGVTKHLNSIPSEGLGDRSYVQSCANTVRCFEHDEAELKHLASEVSTEWYWAEVVKEKQAQAVQPEADGQTVDNLGDDGKRKGEKLKKSTVKGEAREKIVSELSLHHKYNNELCDLSCGPINGAELARQAKVAPSTVTKFFKDEFEDGRFGYHRICKNSQELTNVLRRLNKEHPPARTHSFDTKREKGDRDKQNGESDDNSNDGFREEFSSDSSERSYTTYESDDFEPDYGESDDDKGFRDDR